MESPVSRIEFRRIRLLQCWLLTSQCSDCKLVLPIELSPWQHPTDALGALACCLSGYPWHGWLSGLSGGQSCFTCAPTSHHPDLHNCLKTALLQSATCRRPSNRHLTFQTVLKYLGHFGCHHHLFARTALFRKMRSIRSSNVSFAMRVCTPRIKTVKYC